MLLLAGIAANLPLLTTSMAALKALLLVRRNLAGALGLPPGAALLRLGLLATALLPIGWGPAFVLASA